MKRLIFALLIFAGCSAPNQDKAIGRGYIETHVDGVTLPTVNLWEDPHHRTIAAQLKGSTPVDILNIREDQYLVRNQLNPREYGYLNKGFLYGVEWETKK